MEIYTMGCCGKARRMRPQSNYVPSQNLLNNLPPSANQLIRGNNNKVTPSNRPTCKCGTTMIVNRSYQVGGQRYTQFRCPTCQALKGTYN